MNNTHFGNRRWTRRGLLQGSAAAMAAAYSVISTLQGRAADIPTQFDGSQFQIAAPEPNPKHGGVLRMGILNACISISISPAPSASPRRARLHGRQPDPSRSARQRQDDHS